MVYMMVIHAVEKNKAVKGDREYRGSFIFAQGIKNKEVNEPCSYLGRSIPGCRVSRCKGPKAEACLMCSRNSKEASCRVR